MALTEQGKRWAWAGCFAAVMTVWFAMNYAPRGPVPWMMDFTNNPDHFFLWSEGGTNHNVFNYDPHAADEWRVEHYVAPSSPGQ